jgi:hypothetical protein
VKEVARVKEVGLSENVVLLVIEAGVVKEDLRQRQGLEAALSSGADSKLW